MVLLHWELRRQLKATMLLHLGKLRLVGNLWGYCEPGHVIALGGDAESGIPMSVGIGNTTPNASLDLGDTDKGLLLNRMTGLKVG